MPKTVAKTKHPAIAAPRTNTDESKPIATIPTKQFKLITGSANPQTKASQALEMLCSNGVPLNELSKLIKIKAAIAPIWRSMNFEVLSSPQAHDSDNLVLNIAIYQISF